MIDDVWPQSYKENAISCPLFAYLTQKIKWKRHNFLVFSPVNEMN